MNDPAINAISGHGFCSPKNEGDTIRRWYQEADSDYDYRSQEDQDREFYGLEYIMRIGHKERGW